jgi:lipoate synthase
MLSSRERPQILSMEEPPILPKRFARSNRSGLVFPSFTPPIKLTVLVFRAPQILVEALTSDYLGSRESVTLVAQSGLDVYAHNMETTESRTPFVRDPKANFRQSLSVLRMAKEAKPDLITKTSVMLGVGEEDADVLATLHGTLQTHFH